MLQNNEALGENKYIKGVVYMWRKDYCLNRNFKLLQAES